MKKLLSLLTACLMLAASLTAAMAQAPDLTILEGLPGLYAVTEGTDNNETLVTSTLESADRVYTHLYSSDYYRSTTLFEVICAGEAAPELRLWVLDWTDVGFLDVQRISIAFGDKTFTFEGVANPDLSIYARPSYMEKLLVTFGDTDFIAALAEHCANLGEDEAFAGTMTLHAFEDIEVALGDGFRKDFTLMLQALTALDGNAVEAPAIEAGDNQTTEDATEQQPTESGEETAVEQPAESGNEATEQQPEESGVTYIVVDATNATVRDRAAIRFEPSISADLLAYAYTGETFRLLHVIPNWYVIDVNGYTGYINQGVAKIVE